MGIDEETLDVRAVEVTTGNVGDAPMLPELLDQIPPDQAVGSVTADGACDTRKCHDAITARGAHAVIPPRKNAKPWKPTSAGAIARNEAVNASRYLGRAIWRRWSGYHRRGRVGTRMHCVKLPGQSLMARDFDRQVAEGQVRVAVLIATPRLAYPSQMAVGQVCPGKGELRPHHDLCNKAGIEQVLRVFRELCTAGCQRHLLCCAGHDRGQEWHQKKQTRGKKLSRTKNHNTRTMTRNMRR